MKNCFHLYLLSFLISCSSSHSNEVIELIPTKEKAGYQYVNREGKIVINPQFDDADYFHEGLALVKSTGTEGAYGFINTEGKFIISPQYKYATSFSDGLAWVVSKNGAPVAINKKGEIKFSQNDAERVYSFKEGLAAFEIKGDDDKEKFGFIDKNGKIAITAQFSNVHFFSNGLCAVENEENKWGYVNKEGKLIINYQFESTSKFDANGLAPVSSDSKWGLIDKDGKYVVNPQYSFLVSDGDKYLISQDRKFGWIDSKGKIIINPQFNNALPFAGNDLAPAEISKGSWGFVDKDGKIIINPQFEDATPFNGSIALVKNSGDMFGFIDKDGKYVVNPQFDINATTFVLNQLNYISEFSSVSTDFFDISKILNRINIFSPEGLKIDCSLNDVMKKFNKTQSDFGQYVSLYPIISNEKVLKNIFLNVSIYAKAYNDIPDGWYTTKVFNPNALITAFLYEVDFGYYNERRENVKNEFVKSLKDFQKSASQNLSESDELYINKQKGIELVIYNNTTKLQILIAKQGSLNLNLNEQSTAPQVVDTAATPSSYYRY